MLVAWADVHAQTPMDGGVHGRDQAFDQEAALKYSQAAIGHTPGGYTLHDRQGRAVTLADYQGKPLIISMIYTSCFHICPTTTRNLARAVEQARSAVGADAFTVATIGFDVRNDTPERMRGFARQQHVGSKKDWVFLSGDEDAITQLTADLGFQFVPSSKGFDHLIQTTVVAADGKIYRQIYGMDFDPGFLTGAMQELVLGRIPSLLSLSSLVNKVRLYCTKYDPSSDAYQFNYSMLFAMGFGVVFFVAMGFVVARVWRRNF
jgi:protein SCO1/2